MSSTASTTDPPSIFSLEVNLSTLTSGLSNVGSLVNRAGTIVANPSDYYVSVTRLIVCTQRIPLWQPVLNTTSPNNDGYNTIYSVYLTYGSYNSGQVYLRIINDDNTVTPPQLPVTSQPLNGWGDVFSYNIITQMINIALASAYATLVSNVGAFAILDPNPPYVTWNPVTELFVMNCFPMSQYDTSSSGDKVSIYFNNEYRPYLLGWTIEILTNQTNTTNGQDVLLVLTNLGNNYTPQSDPPLDTPLDADTVMLQMSQNISAPWCFVALSKIQIVSSLPIAFPTLSDLPLALVGSAFNNQTAPILIDYLVNYSQGGANAFQQPISYSATSDIFSSPLKLGGTSPITQFTIGIQWQNLQGQTFNLQTIGLRNSSLKLTFVHKSIIENFNR
jgi:hypothetical protein